MNDPPPNSLAWRLCGQWVRLRLLVLMAWVRLMKRPLRR